MEPVSDYDSSTGEIQSIVRVPAGYGKVAVLEELRTALQVSDDRVVYVGDGSSDVHVMMHVNRCDGLTVAVSEAKYITRIARRTVLSDDALCVLVPILEEIVGWDPQRIRALFGSYGFVLQEWEKVRTDSLTIRGAEAAGSQAVAVQVACSITSVGWLPLSSPALISVKGPEICVESRLWRL